jgi:hypothetical protein
MKLRDYQLSISIQAWNKLALYKIVYIAAEVRTGKTLMALNTAHLCNANNVLFLTKKKAIDSILNDYKAMGYTYSLTVINNESLHKIEGNFDLLISDEHHRNGAFPKPNKITKLIKENYSHLPMIFLSGTPHPENYSQIYHQFWISDNSPFKQPNFYRWADEFVTKKTMYVAYGEAFDYSNANKEKIDIYTSKYFITFTQKNAGFTSKVEEHILRVPLQQKTYNLIELLKNDLVIKGKTEEVLADTPTKLLTKLHQLYSGTIKFESGNSKVVDFSKAEFIRKKFFGQKIGIFYKFKEELNALQQTFGDLLTTDLTEFDNSDKSIALQIVSGREGISLKHAEILVYYNIDFSAVSYWQSRDRLTTMDRLTNKVYWIFSENGIEDKIYKAVMSKKDYTTKLFIDDFRIKNTGKNNQVL